MPRHLKTCVINGLKGLTSYFAPPSEIAASHRRGVRYLVPVEAVKFLWGAMNTVEEGRRYRKHIIVRQYPRNCKVLQLYTYHFPKTWSAACVANRELIKEAQRRAHALEHDRSYAAIEWRIRFLRHYYRVFKGGAEPEQGLKPYSRFYQYTYVVIYRQLKAAQQAAEQAAEHANEHVEQLSGRPLPPAADEITFDPIAHTRWRANRSYPLPHILAARRYADTPPHPASLAGFSKIVT